MPDTWDGNPTRTAPPNLPSARTSVQAQQRVQLPVPVPPKRRASRTIMILGFFAIAAVTAAAASIAWNLTTPSRPQPAPSASAARSAPKPTPAPTSAPVAAPTASATQAAPKPKPKAPPIPDDTTQCFAALLPEKAFGRYKTKLDKACEKSYAYDAMLVVKTAVVRAGGSYTITPAMQEWSNMGWFENAAFAAMRAHCCPDAPALKAPKKLAHCKMEEALAYIANAIDDDKEMEIATDKYFKAAKCIARRGGAGAWGRFDAPSGGEVKYFNKVFERIKKARGR
jgi:serine/threonine-protein kinase